MATCEYCSKRAVAEVKIFGDGWARVCWTHYANRANDKQVVMLASGGGSTMNRFRLLTHRLRGHEVEFSWSHPGPRQLFTCLNCQDGHWFLS